MERNEIQPMETNVSQCQGVSFCSLLRRALDLDRQMALQENMEAQQELREPLGCQK